MIRTVLVACVVLSAVLSSATRASADAFGVSCDLSIHCLLGPDRVHSPRHRHSGAELVLCQHR